MSQDVSPSLGERLRQRRRQLRILQRELAVAADLSPGYLSELEHDTAQATAATLRRLALALDLPADALVEQATRDGRVVTKLGPRTTRTTEPIMTPPRVPIAPRPPMPGGEWVTVPEAARYLQISPGYLRHLMRRGRIGPVKRVQVPGEKGPPRWLLASAALQQAEFPRAGYVMPTHRASEAPEGYLSLDDFSHRTGIPAATVHRRLAANEIVSVRRGRRRWIPLSELRRFVGAPEQDG